MEAVGLDLNELSTLLVEKAGEHYLLVEAAPERVEEWAARLGASVRRCYFTDEHLEARAADGIDPEALSGTYVPDKPSVMSGDFAEMLAAFYLASKQNIKAIDPLKWRFKIDRNQAAPKSDVVHLTLPSWPVPSPDDSIECAEVKSKATINEKWRPIEKALRDSASDREGRLDKTLNWLKELAIQGKLTELTVPQLTRFITPTDYGQYKRCFKAIVVIDAKLLSKEVASVTEAPDQCILVVLSVTNLKDMYKATFAEVAISAKDYIEDLAEREASES